VAKSAYVKVSSPANIGGVMTEYITGNLRTLVDSGTVALSCVPD